MPTALRLTRRPPRTPRCRGWAEHDQHPRRFWRIVGNERGVHGVDPDERDVASDELFAFVADPLLDGAAAEKDDLFLMSVTSQYPH
jgi:hypothetical protein